MNFKMLAFLILSLNLSSSMCMLQLPSAVDYKKFDQDKNQILTAAHDHLQQYYGTKKFSIATQRDRTLFLGKFLGSWSAESFSHSLNYSFNSYMERAVINHDWMEEVHASEIKKDIITVSEFIPLVLARFNACMAKYSPTQAT